MESINSTSNRRLKSEQVISFLVYLALAGLVFIIGYSTRFLWTDLSSTEKARYLAATASMGVLIAGASFMLGGLGGFMFGIPKILQTSAQSPQQLNEEGQSTYLHNDNLVQISDWLTKIIVGVGLTQLQGFPSFMWRIGNGFKYALGGDNVGVVCAIAIILFYVGTGFLLSYIWTRIYFRNMLAQSDKDLDTLREEYELKLDEKEKEIEDIVNVSLYPDAKIAKEMNAEDINESDPNKGLFGGESMGNDRKLTASVVPTEWSKELFKVTLEVSSTNVKRPLTGFVKFYLHPTFKNPLPEIPVVNGTAKLTIIAWGGFTVGAELDKGATRLELDLTELADAPKLFKER